MTDWSVMCSLKIAVTNQYCFFTPSSSTYHESGHLTMFPWICNQVGVIQILVPSYTGLWKCFWGLSNWEHKAYRWHAVLNLLVVVRAFITWISTHILFFSLVSILGLVLCSLSADSLRGNATRPFETLQARLQKGTFPSRARERKGQQIQQPG